MAERWFIVYAALFRAMGLAAALAIAFWAVVITIAGEVLDAIWRTLPESFEAAVRALL